MAILIDDPKSYVREFRKYKVIGSKGLKNARGFFRYTLSSHFIFGELIDRMNSAVTARSA